MKIAYVTSDVRGQTDAVLCDLVARLQGDGKILAGIVKEQAHHSSFANGCDMKVRVLPDGPVIQITQDLGSGSDACRLDPGAIATAVSRVESGPLENADLFILNKFGPEEAVGRGFCAVIGAALERGIPVLVGVGGASIPAFEAFADGLAVALPADLPTILDWFGAEVPVSAEPAAHRAGA